MMQGARCSRIVWNVPSVCSAEYPGMAGGQLSPQALCPPPSIRTRMVSVKCWSPYEVFHTKASGTRAQ